MRKSPYQGLPDERFWKRGVSERGIFDLFNLYKKKFNIEPTDPVATAGSCFAQHIARRLQASGYRYIDTEPAPHGFPPEKAESYGYGLYSARFGNIYTSRQLLQLIQRAFGKFEPIEQIIEKDGRFFDLIRPTIQTNGFSSLEEINSDINYHLRAVRQMVLRCGVFIFTLGLTEAWIDKRDGTAYPVCPGTAVGDYDPEKYTFHNFNVLEIVQDLKDFVDLFRSLNSKVKFIFTVSPVPLIATAEEKHVLVSTVYSKSVLRAAAGEVSDRNELIDYFPSYEIISGIPTRSMFFLPDMRSVHPKGVDYVMEHFFREHPPLSLKKIQAEHVEERDVVCDEIFNEATA